MNFRNVNDEFYDGSPLSKAESFWHLKNRSFRPSLLVTTAVPFVDLLSRYRQFILGELDLIYRRRFD